MTFYIDFDGVILDTMPLYEKMFRENKFDRWTDIYDLFEWNVFLNNNLELNNSISILRELQDKYNLVLLSKVNGISEENAKKDFLSKNGINIKTIFVDYHDKKTNHVDVNKNTILIDDNIDNIIEWNNAGGTSYLYTNKNVDGFNCTNSLQIIKTLTI